MTSNFGSEKRPVVFSGKTTYPTSHLRNEKGQSWTPKQSATVAGSGLEQMSVHDAIILIGFVTDCSGAAFGFSDAHFFGDAAITFLNGHCPRISR